MTFLQADINTDDKYFVPITLMWSFLSLKNLSKIGQCFLCEWILRKHYYCSKRLKVRGASAAGVYSSQLQETWKKNYIKINTYWTWTEKLSVTTQLQMNSIWILKTDIFPRFFWLLVPTDQWPIIFLTLACLSWSTEKKVMNMISMLFRNTIRIWKLKNHFMEKKNGIEYKQLYVSQHFIMRGAAGFNNSLEHFKII